MGGVFLASSIKLAVIVTFFVKESSSRRRVPSVDHNWNNRLNGLPSLPFPVEVSSLTIICRFINFILVSVRWVRGAE